MNTRFVTFVISLLILGGCATRQSSVVQLEPPRDGKILVFIGGNITAKGSLWLPEDASLVTLEDLVVNPEFESRHVVIYRVGPTGMETLKFQIDKMTRADKEKIRLYHGDRVGFVYDRCFGLAPDHQLPQPTPIRCFSSVATLNLS